MKDDKYFVLLCLHFNNGYTERTERYRMKKKRKKEGREYVRKTEAPCMVTRTETGEEQL